MTSRAHEAASAQRLSSTQSLSAGSLVRNPVTERWYKVLKVLDHFYVRAEDLLDGKRMKICVWDIDRWG